MIGPGPAKNQVYVLARHDGLDRASLYLYDASSGDFGAPLVKGEEADIGRPWIDPKTRALVATCEFAARLACKSIDPKLQKYLNALDQYFDKQATVELVNMSVDAGRWLLLVDIPTKGAGYYVFDKAIAQMEKVVEIYPGVPIASLSPTQVVSFDARDGAKLWAYVTAKTGADKPRPMVVLPHSGPESRDHYGYDAFAQFLAAQGYVVLQPHFRGSSGYGEAFATAGKGQWGQRMQDDVTDAVKHMVSTSVADPARICIVGASYGGYAALAGVTLTPELYKCAVSSPVFPILRRCSNRSVTTVAVNPTPSITGATPFGDPDKDRVALLAASPDRLAKKVTAPVLLIHGEDDKTVPVRQSVLMHDALKAAGKSSKLVRLPKADHYWANWEKKDRLTLYQEATAFLKQHLN